MTMVERPDFWVASGHHLVDRDPGGGLLVTDAFLQAYLARPELMPPPEACPVERGLHASLLAAPRNPVAHDELTLMADADARENFALFLSFRDQLLAAPTLEAAYLSLVRGDLSGLPPLFLQQLTHLIARNAFDDETDPFVLRAAECFWRTQRVTFHEGAVLLADQEAIEEHEHARDHSPLLSMLGGPAVSELDVLTEDTAPRYHGRSDAHDFVFDLTSPSHGRSALGTAMSRWIRHFLGIDISFTPVDAVAETRFAWFLALDSEGTAMGNRVWNGEALADDQRERLLALFTFTMPDHARIRADKRGKPAFALLGSTADRLVRIKPQNLIAGLPLVPDAS